MWELRFGRNTEGSKVKDLFLDHMRALWLETEPKPELAPSA